MTELLFRRRIYTYGRGVDAGPTGADHYAGQYCAVRLRRRNDRRKPAHDPDNALFHALSLVSITLVGASLVVRRTLVLPSEALLRDRFDDRVSVSRWRTGYLFLYALCELLGIFGLILRMAGFTLANVWGFYLGGFLLLLLYSPRARAPQSDDSI